MIAKILEMNGSRVLVSGDGSVHKAPEYVVDAEEIVDNGDGSFSITGITEPMHGGLAYTTDGKRALMYSGGHQCWYSWWSE